MSAALVSIEGVLGVDNKQRGFHPSPEGLKLLGALRSGYQIILSSNQERLEAVEHWLVLNGIALGVVYDQLVLREHIYADLSDTDLRLAQLTEFRSKGWGISMVVSADAKVIARAVNLGFNGILWATPVYYRPDWIPGNETVPQPWAVIEEEVDRQLELRNTDPRLKEEQ